MQVNYHLVELAERVGKFIASFSARFPAVGSNEAERDFNRLALDLFELQFEHNAPYRRLCQFRRQSPQNIEHWSQIPAVPTLGFKEQEFTCLPPGQRTQVFHSSGTTQHRPSRHFHNRESLLLYEQSLWPWFIFHTLPDWVETPPAVTRRTTGSRQMDGIHFFALTPAPDAAPHSSLVHMFGTIHSRFRSPGPGFAGRLEADGTWAFTPEEACELLASITASGEPVLVLGTAFLFVHLLDHLTNRGESFTLPGGSRVLETGGYKGRSRTMPKEVLHAEITRRLGISHRQIICEYGMSELSSQAYSSTSSSSIHEDRGTPREGTRPTEPFAFPPWARAQVISPETGREVAEGEMGLLRIIDLANVFSVLAIQTEDLGIRRGNGFELLGRAAMAEPRGCSLMAAQ